MRGDTIFQVFGVHAGREKDVHFGAYRTIEEAQARVEQLNTKEMNGGNWAERHHNQGFAIRPKVVTIEFETPPLPKPRDKYVITTSPKPNRPGSWNSTHVEVFERGATIAQNRHIYEYDRNYAMLHTFEPFRQGTREFALISRNYTSTAVLDLASGTVIAEEPVSGHGFCPVGFYVPDWWDINHGSMIPGSDTWSSDYEWPSGDFGFVWGCVWGDDSSWKIQYLDLSRVQSGVISRDARFGYVELATTDFRTSCLTLDPDEARKIPVQKFIVVERSDGIVTANFAVEMVFDLQSGKSKEWQRLNVANFE